MRKPLYLGFWFRWVNLVLLCSNSLASLTRGTGPKVVRGDPAKQSDTPKVSSHVEHHHHFTPTISVSDSALKFTHVLYNLSPAGKTYLSVHRFQYSVFFFLPSKSIFGGWLYVFAVVLRSRVVWFGGSWSCDIWPIWGSVLLCLLMSYMAMVGVGCIWCRVIWASDKVRKGVVHYVNRRIGNAFWSQDRSVSEG